MLFSRACEYAIRTVLFLAARSDARPMLIRDIAETLEIPPSYLAKIAQGMTRRGLLNSHKGPGGGITLAQSAEEVTLLEVVDAIDGLKFTEVCVLGVPGCPDKGPCPLHGDWGSIRDRIVDMLGKQSV